MQLPELARFVYRGLHLNRVSRSDPRRVAAVQQRRLRGLVRYAVHHSPFFRRKYAGLPLDRFRLSDLPPMSKAEVLANGEDVFTDGDLRLADLRRFVADPANLGTYFHGRFALSHTSGSQGPPLVVVQDRGCIDLFFQMQMTRGNATGRSGPLEALRRLARPARLAVIVLTRGFYASCAAFSYLPPALRPFVTAYPLSMTDPALVEKLNAFRPTILSGYARVLTRLAAEAETGRLRLGDGLRHVVNHSETLPQAERDRLRSAFGVPVLNNYATAECPFLSNGCPTAPGAHVNADWCVLEVVDDRYRPVAAGTPGSKVLITNLANRVQPFIRYEVGDVVTMATDPCGCGSRLPRVREVDGRRLEDFVVSDGTGERPLSGYLFKAALLEVPEVREWQLSQSGPNAFTLRLEVMPGSAADAGRVRAAVGRHLEQAEFRVPIRLDLEVVPRLESDPGTGKFRQTIPLAGRPAGEHSVRPTRGRGNPGVMSDA